VALPLILLLAVAIYAGSVRHNGLLSRSWDDHLNISENADIRAFTLDNAHRWFTSTYAKMYCPVKMAVHSAEYALWGLQPAGYHAVSLGLHCACTALLFALLLALTGSYGGACLAALLFAVHPVAVESVAWASARGDVLYAFFYLSALFVYVNGGVAPTARRLAVVLLLFVLAALSKPSAVTLPAVLLLVDWHRGRRMAGRAIVEKLPFFAVSAAVVAVTIATRSSDVIDAGYILAKYKTAEGYLYAAYAMAFYLVQLAAPIRLSPLYPHPAYYDGGLPTEYYLYPLALLAVGVLAWRCKKHRRALLFGLGFYLIAISPTLQVVPVGVSIAADRYAYLPCAGLYFLLAYGFGQAPAKAKRWLAAVALCAACAFSYRTYGLTKLWGSILALNEQLLSSYPAYSDGYLYVGQEHFQAKDYQRALDYALRGTRVERRGYPVFQLVGECLIHLKQYDKALPYFDIAIAGARHQGYRNPGAWLAKAQLFVAMKQPDSVAACLGQVSDEESQRNFISLSGATWCKAYVALVQGRNADALAALDKVAALRPLTVQDYEWRSLAKYDLGDREGALRDVSAALQLNPGAANLYYNRAAIYLNLRRLPEARQDYRKLLELAPQEREQPDVQALGRRLEED
jgi:tetratricopeptide (TPR) repeat protein